MVKSKLIVFICGHTTHNWLQYYYTSQNINKSFQNKLQCRKISVYMTSSRNLDLHAFAVII